MGIAGFGNPFRYPLPLSAGMGGRIRPYHISTIVLCFVRFLISFSFFVGRSVGGCMCVMDCSFSCSAETEGKIMEVYCGTRIGNVGMDIHLVLFRMGIELFPIQCLHPFADPAKYEEQQFLDFLHAYTDSLNATYIPQVELTEETIEKEVKGFYQDLPEEAGLVSPKNHQRPKFFTFTPLYSGVGVLGSMGPFFAEAQLNRDLLPVQLPFTYAHEFSHLLGVSNEAEANYWAYRACTESDVQAMRYCGYLGLLPYVLSNASSLLTKVQFQEWVRTIRPEIITTYNEKQGYWRKRYSPVIGKVQEVTYNLFLKGNRIPSGRKNYAEVISLLLSLQKENGK